MASGVGASSPDGPKNPDGAGSHQPPPPESLEAFPEALRDSEVMPWDREKPPILWPFHDADIGRPLRDFSSNELIRKRRIVERKNGCGSYFNALLDEIEQILTEREGL